MSYSYEATYSSSNGVNNLPQEQVVSSSSFVASASLAERTSTLRNVYSSVGGSSSSSASALVVDASGANVNSTTEQIAADLLQLNNRASSVTQTSALNVVIGGGGPSRAASVAGSAFVSSGNSASVVLSQIEQAILRSNVPIELNESEEITVNGQRGIWANRQEVINWRGVIPITEYLINEDSNPEVITKRSSQQLEYIQELAIRYLRPPTPPAPGEIIITQEANTLTPPAPPLIIRQQPARPETPEPLVIREAPPQAPAQVGRKVITISGKRIPPPPRKVVIERLAQLPSKPQSVIVERWLPYAQVKRRVIFNKPAQADPVVVKPRNVIVQWEAPQVVIKKELKYLGVIRANPVEYVQRYGSTLKSSTELPEFVLDIKNPDGLVLAADYKYNSLYELEGDLQALRLVDLDREGLAEYRSYLQRLGISYVAGGSSSRLSGVYASSSATGAVSVSGAGFASESLSFRASSSSAAQSSSAVIAEIFASIDRDNNGRLSVEEAEKVLLRLNTRLGRSYGEDEVRAFFVALDSNRDGSIDIQEFRAAFERLF